MASPSALRTVTIARIVEGRHADPFTVLGPHVGKLNEAVYRHHAGNDA
jgi:hypothetical protein